MNTITLNLKFSNFEIQIQLKNTLKVSVDPLHYNNLRKFVKLNITKEIFKTFKKF